MTAMITRQIFPLRAAVIFALLSAPSLYAADAAPLQTALVQYREVEQTYAAEGVVEAVKQSTVAAQISGRVVAVNFDVGDRSEEHTSELQSLRHLVCRLLLEKK